MANLGSILKSVLPTGSWRTIRRATNRMRWLLKLRLLRIYGFPITRRPLRAMQYVLWDPEVESYSYQMGNVTEYARYIAPVLGVSVEQVMAWLEETRSDPYLSRDRGFRWSSKRFMPLGNRLMWYPIVRALKPKLIVEAGIHEGLGSEMLLCALRRNAAEGSPGRLMSFDIYDDTGWIVHPELKANWTVVYESTLTGMAPALRGLEVDLFVHETPHDPEIITGELDIIFRHAAERLAVVDSSGIIHPILPRLAGQAETSHYFFEDEPHNHIVKSHGMGLAIFDRQKLHRLLPPPATRHPEPAVAVA